jgi:glutathione synthase
MTLHDIGRTAKLHIHRLIIYDQFDQKREVSVVYLRAGYGPDDYPSAIEWRGRKILELSRAIKCPTIITQLAGCKKVQQVLATTGVLER